MEGTVNGKCTHLGNAIGFFFSYLSKPYNKQDDGGWGGGEGWYIRRLDLYYDLQKLQINLNWAQELQLQHQSETVKCAILLKVKFYIHSSVAVLILYVFRIIKNTSVFSSEVTGEEKGLCTKKVYI